jgi:hypothetical protein
MQAAAHRPAATGYETMAAGAVLGLTAINVNFTHDFFGELGLGGLAAGCVVT